MIPVKLNAKRANKFNAKKVRVDGYVFDSMAEAKHYGELKIRESAGEISDLKVHPVFRIEINGIKVCSVVLDFSYLDKNGCNVYVDVKGAKTALSSLKKKLVEASYGIDVEIIQR